MFQSKSTISRKALDLEACVTKGCRCKTYTPETDHLHIVLKYDNLVHFALLSLDLLGKAIRGGVWVGLTLDFAEVCKTSTRGACFGIATK